MKKVLVTIWLTLILCAVGSIFWYNDVVYHLPTPLPAHYKPTSNGQLIKLPGALQVNNGKPLFLHFFNPRCPCSRFNMASFKNLVMEYGKQVDFVIIVMSNKPFTAGEIQGKFDLNIPVYFDASIAATCGVYSTPQAVLLDGRHKLYYRGNYNSSRYCTDEKTSYAKMAIKGLLSNNYQIAFGPLALKAYGCQLPNCSE